MSYSSIDEPTNWVPLHLRDRLSFIHILGIAASNLSPYILWMIMPTLFEPISSKLHISTIWKTIILFLNSLIGFIACPLVGVYSDACMFKYGRRRIYMFISLILILIGLFTMCYCEEIGLLLNPSNPATLQQFIFGFSFEFVSIAGSFLQTPARSLASDVCPIHQQNLMANICSFFSGVGGIVTNIIGGLKLYEYTSLTQEQFMLIVSAVMCTIPIIISIVVTPEEPLHVKPPCVNPFKEIFSAVKDMPKPISRTMPSLLLFQVAYFQFAYQFNHFMGKDIFKGDNTDPTQQDMAKRYDDGVAWSMYCGAVRYGSLSLFGFVNAKLIDKFGYKRNTFFGYLCLTIGEILFFFVSNKYAFLFIAILFGISFGVALTAPEAIISISATIYKQNMGTCFGIFMMVAVIGEQISNLGVGSGLSYIWTDNPRMMIAISSIFAVGATLSSLLVIEPDEKKESLSSLITPSGDNSLVLPET